MTLVGMFEKAESAEGGVGGGTKSSLGLWREGGDLGWADALVAPCVSPCRHCSDWLSWLFRSTNVLAEYRGFEQPDHPRFRQWLERVCSHPAVVATSSTRDLYIDSYARRGRRGENCADSSRYAENRPHTSQVADAINSGRGLP